MRPSFAFSSPVMSLNMVDFPAPFWPMSVTFDPSRTEKEVSSMSHFGGAYQKVISSKRMMTSHLAIVLVGYFGQIV